MFIIFFLNLNYFKNVLFFTSNILANIWKILLRIVDIEIWIFISITVVIILKRVQIYVVLDVINYYIVYLIIFLLGEIIRIVLLLSILF